MSDSKKYYYLKLKENFFDTDEMIILESMPDGHLYSNILLKLYLRSLKNEGKLMFNDRIPYNATMLSQITRHSVGTVEKALNIFKELSLIDILDTGAIYMLDIQNYIGKSTTEADRKRLYRQKIDGEKFLLTGQKGGHLSGHSSDISPPEKERELDIDIDIEKEREREENKKNEDESSNPPSKSKKFKIPTLEEVQEYTNTRPYQIDAQRFIDFYTSNGWMVGKNKMKDWKAAVRTWENRENQKGSGKNANTSKPSQSNGDNIGTTY